MPVKIRLQRRGRSKAPFYHIVVADSRSPRDGRFIEKLGTYNPMTVPATIDLDREKAFDWVMNGAQPTDTARAILRFKGVMYRKHLQRGVIKGALTEEKAEQMWQDWIAEKDAKIAARVAKTAEEKNAKLKEISGSVKKAAAPVEEAATETVAPEADATEETVSSAEEAPVEEAPAEAEAPVEAKTEEAPAEEAKTEEKPAEAPAEEPEAEASAEESTSEETEAPAETAEAATEENSSEEEKPAEEAEESSEEADSEEESKE